MKYDELIKNLRECDACVRFCVEYCPKTSKLNKDGKCPTTLAKEAADAIEEMVRKEKFHAFLWNTIQPNEMEQYLAMYRAQAVPSEPPKEETDG